MFILWSFESLKCVIPCSDACSEFLVHSKKSLQLPVLNFLIPNSKSMKDGVTQIQLFTFCLSIGNLNAQNNFYRFLKMKIFRWEIYFQTKVLNHKPNSNSDSTLLHKIDVIHFQKTLEKTISAKKSIWANKWLYLIHIPTEGVSHFHLLPLQIPRPQCCKIESFTTNLNF